MTHQEITDLVKLRHSTVGDAIRRYVETVSVQNKMRYGKLQILTHRE